MKDRIALILTVRMPLRGVALGEYPLSMVEEEHIKTFVEVVNHLLRSYEIENNMAKATLEIVSLRKAIKERLVHLADVLRIKVVRYGNAYRQERIKGIFIDALPANIQSVAGMYWSREQDENLLETVQYAAKQLEQTLKVREAARGAPYRTLNGRELRRNLVATVLNQNPRAQEKKSTARKKSTYF